MKKSKRIKQIINFLFGVENRKTKIGLCRILPKKRKKKLFKNPNPQNNLFFVNNSLNPFLLN